MMDFGVVIAIIEIQTIIYLKNSEVKVFNVYVK